MRLFYKIKQHTVDDRIPQVLARTGYYGVGQSCAFKYEDTGGPAGARKAAEKWLAPHEASWQAEQ